jgi:hypothetical protein
MFVSDARRDMKNRWLATEHYRLQCAENWPESSFKRSTLTAIWSAIESLSGEARPSADIPEFLRRPDRMNGQGHLAA